MGGGGFRRELAEEIYDNFLLHLDMQIVVAVAELCLCEPVSGGLAESGHVRCSLPPTGR